MRLRGFLLALLTLLLLLPQTLVAQRVHVRGYYRKNGTYVQPYTRRAPGTADRHYATPSTPRMTAPRSTTSAAPRDANGHIVRNESAKHRFMVQTGFPHGRPGYVVDHIVPLACGGADEPSNMQWQTAAEARSKDKVERRGCGR